MKTFDKHLFNYLLTAVFFLAFGNISFAETHKTVSNFVQSETGFTKSDSNSKSISFEQNFVAEVSQTISQFESLNFGLLDNSISNRNFTEIKSTSLISESLYKEDLRKLICQQIFPFHFFW